MTKIEKDVMKFSAAVSFVVDADPPIPAASSLENRNTAIRSHRTESQLFVRENDSMQHSDFSNSSFLANQKRENDSVKCDDFKQNNSLEDHFVENDAPDFGILSNSRRLVPLGNDAFAEPERLNSLLFDALNIMDLDNGTNFYSVCDAISDEDYLCSRCETDSQTGTVGGFDCEKASCYEVDSRCPNNRMTVCRYDSLERTFVDEYSDKAFMPYTTERCRRLETRLFKNDRARLPGEEWSWDFSYCLRYNITSDPTLTNDGDANNTAPNTCEMEVDGIVCTSCDLQTVEALDLSSSNGTRTTKLCAGFDCANTLLGYSGHFCGTANLASSSIDYFIYRSLPCDDGCNLCGDRTEDDPSAMMMMKFRDSSFSTSVDENENEYESLLRSSSWPFTSRNCFEAQWEALLGFTDEKTCQALRPQVEKSCGCAPFRSSFNEAPASPEADLMDDPTNDDQSVLDTDSTSTTNIRAFRAILSVTAVIAVLISVVLLRIYSNTTSQDLVQRVSPDEDSADIEEETNSLM